ncbi:hypothetical protein BCR44DRAFT_35255 [Catenaria anguillulae PL171]|uniref:Ribosomal RNA-processing protein 40 n=1 Tax=Catenaria anguillulae PL171 TaxID=765915 RepID=A0A1Y2HWB8_9FUNG|nr:hypothetical protein BCR44DRAFT_35255 [Catenaria anguillulae PL171]
MTDVDQQQPDFPRFVFPGDAVPAIPEPSDADMDVDGGPPAVILGPGVRRDVDQVVATKAGMLYHNPEGNKWWIDSDQKRYTPSANENVIGVVTHRLAEMFRVDIGTAHPAVLSAMAFEGASKRNRPNCNVGDLVYARIAVASKDMDPELECVNPRTGKSSGYGVLKGGFVAKVSLKTCRGLMYTNNPTAKILGKYFTFEQAVGQNGRVWINAPTAVMSVRIARALELSQSMTEDEFARHVKQLSDEIKQSNS